MGLRPAIVYFPIALLLTAALLLAPSLILRHELSRAAAYLALMLLSAGLVGVNGHLAGRKVLREGVGVENRRSASRQMRLTPYPPVGRAKTGGLVEMMRETKDIAERGYRAE